MSVTAKQLGFDLLKSYGITVAMNQIDLQRKLNFGSNPFVGGFTNGAMYALSSDAINYLSIGQSKLLNGDIAGLVDDSVFFGVISSGVKMAGLDATIMKTIETVSPFGRSTNIDIAEAGLLTGGRLAGDYIVSQSSVPSFLKTVRRPLKVLWNIGK